MDSIKRQLVEELAAAQVNVLRIRALCRDWPGLVSTANVRLRIWSLLLLGPHTTLIDADIPVPTTPAGEQHVLEADVKRTRSEIEEFRSDRWRKATQHVLQHFCCTHRLMYKQGMNEVLAPFIYLVPPPKGTKLSYSLYEAFLFRYLERFLCVDDSQFLFRAFRLFHVLCVYHEPTLALHLKTQHFPPELYAPSWFLTFYSRSLPLHHTLRLWDMIIAVDDPAFMFFIGLSLLRKCKEELLLQDTDHIPEVMQKLGFHGEEDIDQVVTDAVSLYKRTPRSLVRNLRLCCVSTTQLQATTNMSLSSSSSSSSSSSLMSKTPSSSNGFTTSDSTISIGTSSGRDRAGSNAGASPGLHPYARATVEQDRTMAVQAVRACLTITPKELLAVLLSAPSSSSSSSADAGGINGTVTTEATSVDGIWGGLEGGGAGSTVMGERFLLIDVRAKADVERSGAGTFVTAIQVEPSGLLAHSSSEALNRWLGSHLTSVTGRRENSTEAATVGGGDEAAAIATNIAEVGSDGAEATSTGPATISDGSAFVGIGGVICVVDFPSAYVAGSGRGTALWRRLLLGEGDGGAMKGSNQGQGQGAYYSVGSILGYGISTFLGNNNSSSGNHDEKGDVSNDPTLSDKDLCGGEESYSAHCDPQSLFADAEKLALVEDSASPAMRLAMALQQLGCARVCVVDGGFVALVNAMMASKGCVDPGVLVGHDEGRWAEYCSNHRSNSSSGNVNEEINNQHHSRDKTMTTTAVDHHLVIGGDGDDHPNPRTSSFSSIVSSSFNSNNNNNNNSSKALSPGGQTAGADLSNVSGMINVKKARDSLSMQQQMKMALEVARRLGHSHMEKILCQRIKQYEDDAWNQD